MIEDKFKHQKGSNFLAMHKPEYTGYARCNYTLSKWNPGHFPACNWVSPRQAQCIEQSVHVRCWLSVHMRLHVQIVLMLGYGHRLIIQRTSPNIAGSTRKVSVFDQRRYVVDI